MWIFLSASNIPNLFPVAKLLNVYYKTLDRLITQMNDLVIDKQLGVLLCWAGHPPSQGYFILEQKV